MVFILSLFIAHFIHVYSPQKLRASPPFYFLSLAVSFAGAIWLFRSMTSTLTRQQAQVEESSARVAGGIYGDLNNVYPLPELHQSTDTEMDDFARVSTPQAYLDQTSAGDPNVCVTGDWIDFDQTCNPATGTKTQVRTVLQWPKDPNISCGNLTRYVPCALDCVTSDWTDWSTCNPTTGQKTRSKSVSTPPQNGGASCGAMIDSQSCPIDCQLSPWSDWSACDAATRSQKRSRSVIVPPMNSGLACGELQQTRTC